MTMAALEASCLAHIPTRRRERFETTPSAARRPAASTSRCATATDLSASFPSNGYSQRLRPDGELAEPTAVVNPDVDEELAAARLARNGGRSLAIVDDRGRFIGLRLHRDRPSPSFRESTKRTLPRLRRFSRANVPGSNRGRGAGSFLPALAPFAVARSRSARRHGVRRHRCGVRGAALSTGAARLLHPGGGLHGRCGGHADRSTRDPRDLRRRVKRDIVVRELSTGLVIGILLGAAFFPFAYSSSGAMLAWLNRRARAARQHRNGDARGDGAPLRHQPARPGSGVRRRTARDGDPGPALDPHLPRDRDGSRRLDPERTSVVVRSMVQRGR